MRVAANPLHTLAIAWLTTLVPSIALGAAASALLPGTAQPDLKVAEAIGMFAVVIAAPLLETFIMGAVLLLLLRLVSPTVAVVLSSLGWGIAHSIAAPAWGLVIWWPFLIFSTLFVTWRARSLGAAFALAASAHALHNLAPALLLLWQARG